MIKEIQKLYPLKKKFVYSGLGNQKSDAIAYVSAGLKHDLIFIVRKKKLYQLSGKYCFTFESMNRHIDKLFPFFLTNDFDDESIHSNNPTDN